MVKPNSIHLKACLSLLVLLSFFSISKGQSEKPQVLKHVVFFQFKEGVSEEQKTEAVENFRELKNEIPEIKKFEGGLNISEEGFNKGFTHCFTLTFESEEARDIYLPHPAHKKLVEKNKPLFSDLLVVDYWGEEQ